MGEEFDLVQVVLIPRPLDEIDITGFHLNGERLSTDSLIPGWSLSLDVIPGEILNRGLRGLFTARARLLLDPDIHRGSVQVRGLLNHWLTCGGLPLPSLNVQEVVVIIHAKAHLNACGPSTSTFGSCLI